MYVIYTNAKNPAHATAYLLYFPDSSGHTPKKLQKLFEEWLNDENIEHDCWVYIDGKKYGLSFDKDDFVKWLNENIFADCDDKAKVAEENLESFPPGLPLLYY